MISPVYLRRERCRKASSEHTVVTCWESALSRIRVTAAGRTKFLFPRSLCTRGWAWGGVGKQSRELAVGFEAVQVLVGPHCSVRGEVGMET